MNIIEIIKSQPTQDGDGVKISRIADFEGGSLDPFLMIDEIKSHDETDYIGGFPAHPHRGIETFTYMISGGFKHQDQMGNKKVIHDGHVQWMSTGYGVVHSEMPVLGKSAMHGFQIWINMAAKDKLRPAKYQDSMEKGVPEIVTDSGVTLRALAGTWNHSNIEISSALLSLSADAAIADIRMPEKSQISIFRPGYDQCLLYLHSGEISGISSGNLVILDPENSIDLTAIEESGALLFFGNKLKEPIAHMGPFVMNTQEELMQAVDDYRSGKFGNITE